MDVDQNMPDGKERRRHPRVRAQIPIELRDPANSAPLRVSAVEISLCGCYVESMFTLSVGTKATLTLWLNEHAIRVHAVVITRHPQVGNGFEFLELSPDSRLKLAEFIQTCSSDRKLYTNPF